jgi:hemerythrin superfamily protein
MSMVEKARAAVGMYGDNDIRSKLKADHETIRELAETMADDTGNAKRSAAFKQLKKIVTAHARAEEAVVYTALVKARSSPDSRDHGNEGFVEHGLVDGLMEQIAATRPAGSALWRARAKVLSELLDHHIQEEERDIFEELGEHFPDERREQMADDFEARKARLLRSGRATGTNPTTTASRGGAAHR